MHHSAVRIRTVTASLDLAAGHEATELESTIGFLKAAKAKLESQGYEVQTLRLSHARSMNGAAAQAELPSPDSLRALDDLLQQQELLAALGPIAISRSPDAVSRWACEAAKATRNISFSIEVAADRAGVNHEAVLAAAKTISALAEAEPGGEANFRFAAAALVPPGTPFFPVAYDCEPHRFSVGLESAPLVATAFADTRDTGTAEQGLLDLMRRSLGPLARLCHEIGEDSERRFLGLDVSPAPSLEASIAEAIETLTGEPFGAPSTLAGCAVVTGAIRRLRVPKCGYSGLMLPLLEDTTLARRATEGRYGVQELLLYSSVCGTGLDVVPLPGNVGTHQLASVVLDVATLAHRLRKPLAARLLPIPGAGPGDEVSFSNPHLAAATVVPLIR